MPEKLWRCSACRPLKALFHVGHLSADTTPTTSPSKIFFLGFTWTVPNPDCSLWEWTAGWLVHFVKVVGLWTSLVFCDPVFCFYTKCFAHTPLCACVGLNNRWSTTWKTALWINFSFRALSALSKALCQCAWLGIRPSLQSNSFSLPQTNTRWSFSTALPRCAGLWNTVTRSDYLWILFICHILYVNANVYLCFTKTERLSLVQHMALPSRK